MEWEITPGQMIPQYNTVLFTDVYKNVESFIDDYKTCQIPQLLKEDSIKTLFYLLYARYGNNPLANLDINQFKYKVFAIIFQYGPTWEKRLELQKEIREMSVEEARLGATSIYNNALNPETAPSTQTLEELSFINSQNTSKYKKSKTDAFTHLWELLRFDVSEEFIKKFRVLFDPIPRPDRTYIYTTVEETEE